MTLRNVEIKARIPSAGEMREKLARLGIDEPAGNFAQVDTYFDVPRGRMKLREFPGGASAPSQLIYYRRADEAGARVSNYQIIEIPDAEAALRLFADAFGVKVVVDKHRYLYMLGRTRIHLDEVRGLGSFLEIEVVLADDEEVAEGEAEARRIIADLGIETDDFVSGSYCDMVGFG
jgi:predicted adenylyl cyclase CyaB